MAFQLEVVAWIPTWKPEMFLSCSVYHLLRSIQLIISQMGAFDAFTVILAVALI